MSYQTMFVPPEYIGHQVADSEFFGESEQAVLHMLRVLRVAKPGEIGEASLGFVRGMYHEPEISFKADGTVKAKGRDENGEAIRGEVPTWVVTADIFMEMRILWHIIRGGK